MSVEGATPVAVLTAAQYQRVYALIIGPAHCLALEAVCRHATDPKAYSRTRLVHMGWVGPTPRVAR